MCRDRSTKAPEISHAKSQDRREGRIARRLRKKIEMLFAHLKRILKLAWLRLRGPNGAHD
jgi:hypothetical protein